MNSQIIEIDVERIFLDALNPRFPEDKVESEKDALELLCNAENVLKVAQDIVEYGLNPLDLIGVIRDGEPTEDLNHQNYIVVEGNRRICALKLLNDPEIAPSDQRKAYRQLSEKWKENKINKISCCILNNRDASKVWLERLHGDSNGGIGRKKWDAEQKERFTGGSRNAIALAVFDYAEKKMKVLTEEQRKKTLTTAQRFLSNSNVRDAIGIDGTSAGDVHINRKREDFEARLLQFVKDLISGEKVHSRANKNDYEDYAIFLNKNVSISDERIDPVSLFKNTTVKKVKGRPNKPTPSKPSGISNIPHSEEIYKLLEEFGNQKLKSFYYGISKIKLNDNFTPILTVSCWVFIESLSAAAGRNPSTSFKSFYSKEKIKNLGLDESDKLNKALWQSLDSLQNIGNITKHHNVSANFNGPQLANDMACLQPLIIATLKQIISEQKNTG